jgi:CDP-6-deoxy-D-xylo-4-hexulose-3-dehydrase
LPFGYDHKYVYDHVGYNLKASELQAAIGVAQLDKLDDIIQKRKDNFSYLYAGITKHLDVFHGQVCEFESWVSPFGFAITLRDDVPFTRDEIVRYLEEHKIGTRLLFAGNITKQPAYKHLPYARVTDLPNTDKIMRDTFWIGCHPGIDKQRLDYMVETIDTFIEERA